MQKFIFIWMLLFFLLMQVATAQIIPSVYQEKVFLHTDKSFYLTGEDLYFKAYLVNAADHRPSDLSKVIYVELVSDKVYLQTRISAVEGSNGSFFLPADLHSGKYVVRAYTRWMRNFDEAFFFQKTIAIFNPFEPASVTTPAAEHYDIQFFPEGGQFVSSIESKTGFRVVNEDGQGIDFRGIVVNAVNDTLATFQPLKFGIGHFYFTPVSSNTYFAQIYDLNGKLIAKQTLPPAAGKGYALKLSDTGNGRLSVRANSNTPDYEGQDIVCLVHSRGKMIFRENRKIISQQAEFVFPVSQLEDGINHITLFDNSGNPVAERLYFKRPEASQEIKIRPDQEMYPQRSKIQLDLQVPDRQGLNISMAVYHADDLQSPEKLNIANYLLLTSDLKGYVESPWYYFEKDSQVNAATDNLMLTHGWRRFEWKKVQEGSQEKISLFPEYVAPLVEAEIISRETQKPAAGITAYLSMAGKNFVFKGSQSDSLGKVYFEMHRVYQKGELIVRLTPRDDSLYQIRILDPFSPVVYPGVNTPLGLSLAHKAQLEDRSVYMQARRVYQKESKTKPQADSLHFYGIPDEKYYLDDYTRFPVMEEVMREYIRGVMVRKAEGKFQYRIFDLNTGELFEEEPLVLLDGVPVFDINKIMALDPFLIKSIEVKRRKEFLGRLGFSGVVSYLSYEGNAISNVLGDKEAWPEYQGLQVQRVYFTPQYEAGADLNNRLPDFRDLLYWNPNIEIPSSGAFSISFYSSSLSGKYNVYINGLSEDGKLFHGSQMIEVK
ncbi:MAG: hypothetical protein R3D00_30760 [Bacteroidia bacterium]